MKPDPPLSPLPRTVLVLLISCAPVTGIAQTDVTNVWALRLPGRITSSSPALGPDGTIYQATFSGALVAATPQGKSKWLFEAGREIKSSPAIADDGTIYFGSRDRKFYAVTPRGKLKWTFPTGAWVDSSPAIGADGTIYFGSWDTNFYALNPDGSKKWEFASGGIIDSSPAIATNGVIYFGSHDKKFYALKADGRLLWSFATGGPIISSPAINLDGTVYFTSTDGNLYALKPDGTERWRLRTGSATGSSPVLDGAGMIYLGARETCIGVSENGEKRWEFPLWGWVDATPTVVANSLIYCSSRSHWQMAMTSGGALSWRFYCSGEVLSSSVIGNDGTIYVPCDGALNAITSTNPAPLAKSPWPMFRANPRHTGRVPALTGR